VFPANRLHFSRRKTRVKNQDPVGIFFHQQEMPFSYLEYIFLITLMYLFEFIVSSIGISESTPEKLKLPQIIFFWRCFTTSLKLGRT